LEDIWENCENEQEVLVRDHSRLTIQQIREFKLKFQLYGIVEDGTEVIEPGWDREEKHLGVDWGQDEDDDINLRTRTILTCTDNWLKRQRERKVLGQSCEKITRPSSYDEVQSIDKVVTSPVAGGSLTSREQKEVPSCKENPVQFTESSLIIEQRPQEVEGEAMASSKEELSRHPGSPNIIDGGLPLIEASKMEQSLNVTPTKEDQTLSAIPPWLARSVNAKRRLQPVATPVKDIVTRYTARGSKLKKMKTEAHLILDPVTGRLTAELATYKQGGEAGEIEAEDFKVATVDLGTINRGTGNRIFKFSVDHMLTQSEKDSKEKKELKT
jgi:hypothetical protein